MRRLRDPATGPHSWPVALCVEGRGPRCPHSNDYDYVSADPINAVDLDGRATCSQRGWRKWACRVAKGAQAAAAITSYCPLAQCQAVTLTLGAVAVAGHYASGNRRAAGAAAIGTAASLVGAGRGKWSWAVPGKGRIVGSLRDGVRRFESGTRGGALGRAWGRSRTLGRANTASVWLAVNGYNSGLMR